MAAHLHQLSHEVFAGSYIQAMHWALAVPVVILVAGALACLAMRREPARASTASPAATSIAVVAQASE
jgi:hypothetical protein